MANTQYRLENVRVLPGQWRNFAGRRTDYNLAGNRNFTLAFNDSDQIEMLKSAGFNIKYTQPREDHPDYDTMAYLTVKVVYHHDPSKSFMDPEVNVYLQGTNQPESYDESLVGILDNARILYADCILNGNEYTVQGRSGTSAYLNLLNVVVAKPTLDASFNTNYGSICSDLDESDI